MKQDYLLWLADLVHNFDDEQAKKDQEYLMSDKFYQLTATLTNYRKLKE